MTEFAEGSDGKRIAKKAVEKYKHIIEPVWVLRNSWIIYFQLSHGYHHHRSNTKWH